MDVLPSVLEDGVGEVVVMVWLSSEMDGHAA